MGDLPRPGLEPVSPALAGRFSTTAPPGKPQIYIYSLVGDIHDCPCSFECPFIVQISKYVIGAFFLKYFRYLLIYSGDIIVKKTSLKINLLVLLNPFWRLFSLLFKKILLIKGILLQRLSTINID